MSSAAKRRERGTFSPFFLRSVDRTDAASNARFGGRRRDGLLRYRGAEWNVPVQWKNFAIRAPRSVNVASIQLQLSGPLSPSHLGNFNGAPEKPQRIKPRSSLENFKYQSSTSPLRLMKVAI